MRWVRFTICFALTFASLLFSQVSDGTRRIIPTTGRSLVRKALLIGNQKYRESPLQNPVNDVRDLAKSLQLLGFQTETLTDSGKSQILTATRTFAGGLAAGDIAVFFYSGHGFQIDSENYLVPVDFSA